MAEEMKGPLLTLKAWDEVAKDESAKNPGGADREAPSGVTVGGR